MLLIITTLPYYYCCISIEISAFFQREISRSALDATSRFRSPRQSSTFFFGLTPHLGSKKSLFSLRQFPRTRAVATRLVVGNSPTDENTKEYRDSAHLLHLENPRSCDFEQECGESISFSNILICSRCARAFSIS